jgi:hypothetical protein
MKLEHCVKCEVYEKTEPNGMCKSCRIKDLERIIGDLEDNDDLNHAKYRASCVKDWIKPIESSQSMHEEFCDCDSAMMDIDYLINYLDGIRL